jgi:Glucose-6-phosphate dehydrogenase, C-terminal domain.
VFIPYYIRTGKRLDGDFTHIIIEFKFLPGIPYFKNNPGVTSNLVVIKVQPEVSPWGEIVCELGEAEDIKTVDIDIGLVDKVRRDITVFKDRRPAVYL